MMHKNIWNSFKNVFPKINFIFFPKAKMLLNKNLIIKQFQIKSEIQMNSSLITISLIKLKVNFSLDKLIALLIFQSKHKKDILSITLELVLLKLYFKEKSYYLLLCITKNKIETIFKIVAWILAKSCIIDSKVGGSLEWY